MGYAKGIKSVKSFPGDCNMQQSLGTMFQVVKCSMMIREEQAGAVLRVLRVILGLGVQGLKGKS